MTEPLPQPPYWPANQSRGEVYASPFWDHFLYETDAVDHAYLVDAPAGLTVLYFRDGVYVDYDIGLWFDQAVRKMRHRFGVRHD